MKDNHTGCWACELFLVIKSAKYRTVSRSKTYNHCLALLIKACVMSKMALSFGDI